MRATTVGDTSIGSNNVTGVVSDYGTAQAAQDSIDDSTPEDETITFIQKNMAAVSPTTLSAANSTSKTYLLTSHAAAQFTALTYSNASVSARIYVTSGDALTITGVGWTIERLYIQSTAGQAVVVSGVSARLRRLIVKSNVASIRSSGSGTRTITNVCCFWPANAGAFTFYNDGGTTNIYHITARGRSSGLTIYNGATTSCNNTYAFGGFGGGSTSEFYGSPTGDYNASGNDASSPGAHGWDNVSSVVTTDSDGSEDFTLNSTHDEGTYSCADESGTESDLSSDILGTSRTTYFDVGCWETPATPKGFVPSLRYPLRSSLLRR